MVGIVHLFKRATGSKGVPCRRSGGRFNGDPTSLACDNIYILVRSPIANLGDRCIKLFNHEMVTCDIRVQDVVFPLIIQILHFWQIFSICMGTIHSGGYAFRNLHTISIKLLQKKKKSTQESKIISFAVFLFNL